MSKPNAAQQLGNVIKWHREKKGWDRRRVANATSASIGLVEDWESGKDVPTARQWHDLQATVNNRLKEYNELYRQARAEQGLSTDRPDTVPDQPTGPRREVVVKPTHFGQKVMTAIAQGMTIPPIPPVVPPQPKLAVVPPPEPEKPEPASGHGSGGFNDPAIRAKAKETRDNLPEGYREALRRNARIDWVRNQFRLRPDAPIAGPDGIREMLTKHFGVALSADLIRQIKEEVKQEKATQVTPPVKPAPTPKKEPKKPVQKPTPVGPKDIKSALEAAAELVLEAVPNLASFTIRVTEDGAVSVDYKTREVKVVEESGSITLGKK